MRVWLGTSDSRSIAVSLDATDKRSDARCMRTIGSEEGLSAPNRGGVGAPGLKTAVRPYM